MHTEKAIPHTKTIANGAMDFLVSVAWPHTFNVGKVPCRYLGT